MSMASPRIQQHVLPCPGRRERLAKGSGASGKLHLVVAGGGLAGLAAATVLAERGAAVTVVEREAFLGGRAGAWTDRLQDGHEFQMERGFHAFFRQYYNLRALLRRIDPELAMLEPMPDYPILGPDGLVESFAGLPLRSPWNIIALTKRTPTLGLRDLLRVNGRAALEMLRYDSTRTYELYDHQSAREYLDSLAFPPAARRMLFDVFSHSFFNPEAEMSAGELLMMFHFYFIGNGEGLIFDVVRRPFSKAIWEPLEAYLTERGVQFEKGCAVRSLTSSEGRGRAAWRVETERGSLDADGVVLALTVPALQAVVDASPGLDDVRWRAAVAGLELTRPFAVWRLWLDRRVAPERAPFAGTTGVGRLDNISIYEALEDESRAWAERTGGSIVELHAYGVAPELTEAELRADLLAALQHFYPETISARTLDERFLLRRDCPAFAPGSFAERPRVRTPFKGLTLAGDFVRLPIPSALMERAVSAGFLAANQLLAPHDVRPETILSIPPRGLFAGPRRRRPPQGVEA